MTRRVLSGLALLVVAALVAAQPCEAKKWEHPVLGYPAYEFGKIEYSAVADSVMLDSVRAPAGYLIARVDVTHSDGGTDTLIVSFVNREGAAQDSTEIDKSAWVIMAGAASTGMSYAIPAQCEKAYFHPVGSTTPAGAGVHSGSFFWSAYFVDTDQSTDGISGVTWP